MREELIKRQYGRLTERSGNTKAIRLERSPGTASAHPQPSGGPASARMRSSMTASSITLRSIGDSLIDLAAAATHGW